MSMRAAMSACTGLGHLQGPLPSPRSASMRANCAPRRAGSTGALGAQAAGSRAGKEACARGGLPAGACAVSSPDGGDSEIVVALRRPPLHPGRRSVASSGRAVAERRGAAPARSSRAGAPGTRDGAPHPPSADPPHDDGRTDDRAVTTASRRSPPGREGLLPADRMAPPRRPHRRAAPAAIRTTPRSDASSASARRTPLLELPRGHVPGRPTPRIPASALTIAPRAPRT